MGKGSAIAGLVCSIVALVLALLSGICSIIALPLAIVGLVLSIKGGHKLAASGMPKGIATAGLVVGIIATVVAGIAFFTCGLCILCAGGAAAGCGSLF